MHEEDKKPRLSVEFGVYIPAQGLFRENWRGKGLINKVIPVIEEREGVEGR